MQSMFALLGFLFLANWAAAQNTPIHQAPYGSGNVDSDLTLNTFLHPLVDKRIDYFPCNEIDYFLYATPNSVAGFTNFELYAVRTAPQWGSSNYDGVAEPVYWAGTGLIREAIHGSGTGFYYQPGGAKSVVITVANALVTSQAASLALNPRTGVMHIYDPGAPSRFCIKRPTDGGGCPNTVSWTNTESWNYLNELQTITFKRLAFDNYGFLWVLSKTDPAAITTFVQMYLHKIDPATGAVLFSTQICIGGTCSNIPDPGVKNIYFDQTAATVVLRISMDSGDAQIDYSALHTFRNQHNVGIAGLANNLFSYYQRLDPQTTTFNLITVSVAAGSVTIGGTIFLRPSENNGFSHFTSCGHTVFSLLNLAPSPGTAVVAPGQSIPITFTISAKLGIEPAQTNNVLRGPYRGWKARFTTSTLPAGWEFEDHRSAVVNGLGDAWYYQRNNNNRVVVISDLVISQANGEYESTSCSITLFIHPGSDLTGSFGPIANLTAANVGASIAFTSGRGFNNVPLTVANPRPGIANPWTIFEHYSRVQHQYVYRDNFAAYAGIAIGTQELGYENDCILSTGLDNLLLVSNAVDSPTTLSDDIFQRLPDGRRCPLLVQQQVTIASGTTVSATGGGNFFRANCFAIGDVVMLYCAFAGSCNGIDSSLAGSWEFNTIRGISAASITLNTIQNPCVAAGTCGSCGAWTLYRVPQFQRLSVTNINLGADGYDPRVGGPAVTPRVGMILFSAKQLYTETLLDANGAGFGPSSLGNIYTAVQGVVSPNGNGGAGAGGSGICVAVGSLGASGGGLGGGNCGTTNGAAGGSAGFGGNGGAGTTNPASSNGGGGGGGSSIPTCGAYYYPYPSSQYLYFPPAMPHGGGGGAAGYDGTAGGGATGAGGGGNGAAGSNGCADGGNGGVGSRSGGVIFMNVCEYVSNVGATGLSWRTNGAQGNAGGAGGSACGGHPGGGGGGGGGGRGSAGGLVVTRIMRFIPLNANNPASSFPISFTGGTPGAGGAGGSGTFNGGNGAASVLSGVTGHHVDIFGFCTTCPYGATLPDVYSMPDPATAMSVPKDGPIGNDYYCDGLGNQVVDQLFAIGPSRPSTPASTGAFVFSGDGSFVFTPAGTAPYFGALTFGYQMSILSNIANPEYPIITPNAVNIPGQGTIIQAATGLVCPIGLPMEIDRLHRTIPFDNSDRWGDSVDVSNNFIVSGGFNTNRVNVYILGSTIDVRVEAGWKNYSVIAPPTTCNPSCTNFGSRVAISGEQIAIRTLNNGVPEIQIYRRDTDPAKANVWNLLTTIPKPGAASNGFGLSLRMDGIWLMASDSSKVYIYRQLADGTYTTAPQILTGVFPFGTLLDIAGNYALISDGAGHTNPGDTGTADVIVLRRKGFSWIVSDRLTHPFRGNNPSFSSSFGVAIGVDFSGLVMVSDSEYNTASTRNAVNGAVFVYEQIQSGRWYFSRFIQPPPAATVAPAQPNGNPTTAGTYLSENFGRSAHLRDGMIVAADVRFQTGDLYVYDAYTTELLAFYREPNADSFGASLRTSRGRFAVGAPRARGACQSLPSQPLFTTYGSGISFGGHSCRAPVPIDVNNIPIPPPADPVLNPLNGSFTSCSFANLVLSNWETTYFGSYGSGIEPIFNNVRGQRELVPGRLIDLTLQFTAPNVQVTNLAVTLSAPGFKITFNGATTATVNLANIAAGGTSTLPPVQLAVDPSICPGDKSVVVTASLSYTAGGSNIQNPCSLFFDVQLLGNLMEAELYQSVTPNCADPIQLYLTPLASGIIDITVQVVPKYPNNVNTGLFSAQVPSTPPTIASKIPIKNKGFGNSFYVSIPNTHTGSCTTGEKGLYTAVINYKSNSNCNAPSSSKYKSVARSQTIYFYYASNTAGCNCL